MSWGRLPTQKVAVHDASRWLCSLQGIRFDLVVHNPLWSLQGFFSDFDTWRNIPSDGSCGALRKLSSDVLQQAHTSAQVTEPLA